MNIDDIKRRFQQANALQLLRDSKAALVIAFLWDVFQDGRKNIGQDELISSLADYLKEIEDDEDLDTTDTDGFESNLFDKYRNRAKTLLRDWESRQKRYLRGDNNAEGHYEYSLTEHTTRAWQWIDSLEQGEFTGTRSRLEDIFEKIRRVVENSTEKTDAERIGELEQKQALIQQEITDIRAGKSPYQPFDGVRIKEEYEGLLEQVRALSTDFKAVESNFERIRTDMLRRQTAQDGSKGMLLGSMLDARDELDRTPQGMSFTAFFEALRDPQRQHQFASYVQALRTILAAHQIDTDSGQLLSRLHRHLLSEAQPVMEANRRIADRISRLVAETTAQDRQLLKDRIMQVKAALLDPVFLNLPLDPSAFFWEIDSPQAEVRLPLEKTLRTQQNEGQVRFAMPLKMASFKPDFEFDNKEIITVRLNTQIDAALDTTTSLTLAALIEQYPLREGFVEVLAYLNIVAAPDNRHFIEIDQQDVLLLDKAVTVRFLEGPRVFLVKKSKPDK